MTDGKQQTTTWGYDQYGRVTNKLDAAGNLIFLYQYDADNRLTNRWTPAMGTTMYRCDAVGNLTNVDYSGGTIAMTNLVFAYDAMNRLTNMVDAVGTTAYGYDAAGQLSSEDGPWVNDTVSYSYANRLRQSLSLQAPNASAWSQSYGYDSARRLTSVTSPAGNFGYIYDPARQQRLAMLTLPGGACITNTFDSVARLSGTWLKTSGGTNLDSYQYGYNQASQRTGVTRTAGDYVNYTYDNAGQLVAASGYEAGGTDRLNEQFGYVYDAAGNLQYRTNNALIQNYSVNNLNELSQVTRGGAGPLTVVGTTTSPATNVTVNGSNAVLYADNTFAAPGMVLTSGVYSFTYTAIAKDSYGRVATDTIVAGMGLRPSYTYDLNGNLLVESSMTTNNRTFSYDDENQLVSVYVTNQWRSDFVYDGKMRRRIERDYSWNGSAWTQTNEVRFIYDGNLVIQERDANNLPQVTYTRGNDLSGSLQGAGGIGGLLARTDNHQLNSGSIFANAFYHADGNGNICCLIYSNQLIAAKYLYDPYGNTLSMYGWLATANIYRFSSKEWNDLAGLYYYGYRFYDPTLQRWPNRDPLGDKGSLIHAVTRIGPRLEPWSAVERAMMVQQFQDPLNVFTEVNLNPSLFVANNPINEKDPLGLLDNPITSTLPGLSGSWNYDPYGPGGPGYGPGYLYQPGCPGNWGNPFTDLWNFMMQHGSIDLTFSLSNPYDRDGLFYNLELNSEGLFSQTGVGRGLGEGVSLTGNLNFGNSSGVPNVATSFSGGDELGGTATYQVSPSGGSLTIGIGGGLGAGGTVTTATPQVPIYRFP